jgi:tetratricopeptide (TPR) repeat protein
MEDYGSSLTYFESLPSNAIFEDELQQIMTIAFKLSDYPLASACLEKLSNITDIYMPKHAKLLKLLGETDKAITLYADYLASFNEDTKAWLELGELYFDIKAYDAALMAFEVVLSQDAKNLRASNLIKEVTEIQQD